MSESQNIKYKESWRDEYLKWLCGFANATKCRCRVKKQVSRDVEHYNLQMIIAVGFKVNLERAVQFRKWVNQIANDYTIQSWVLDSDRLKLRLI